MTPDNEIIRDQQEIIADLTRQLARCACHDHDEQVGTPLAYRMYAAARNIEAGVPITQEDYDILKREQSERKDDIFRREQAVSRIQDVLLRRQAAWGITHTLLQCAVKPDGSKYQPAIPPCSPPEEKP